MKALLSILLTVGIGLTGSASVHAAPQSRAAASFFRSPFSARTADMGGAFVAIVDDAGVANPAAQTLDNNQDLNTTFYKPTPTLVGDVFFSFGAYKPLSGLGNLGINLKYASLDAQRRTHAQGQAPGGFGLELGVSYGTTLTGTTSVGVTMKLMHENLVDPGAGMDQGKGQETTFAGDIGMTWKPSDRLTLAWALRNVGPNMTFIDADQADPLPQNFTLELAYYLFQGKNASVLITGDVYNSLADLGFLSFLTGWTNNPIQKELKQIDYRTGIAWQYNLAEEASFVLRAGYAYDRDGNRKIPNLGLGLKYRWLIFDLSYFSNKPSVLRHMFRVSSGVSF